MFTKGDKRINTKGRPPIGQADQRILREIKGYAKLHSKEAFDKIVAIMRDKRSSPQVQLAAADKILDRGYGKPKETIETNITVFEGLSDDELQRRIAELSDRARRLSEGSGAKEIEGELLPVPDKLR